MKVDYKREYLGEFISTDVLRLFPALEYEVCCETFDLSLDGFWSEYDDSCWIPFNRPRSHKNSIEVYYQIVNKYKLEIGELSKLLKEVRYRFKTMDEIRKIYYELKREQGNEKAN